MKMSVVPQNYPITAENDYNLNKNPILVTPSAAECSEISTKPR